MIYYPHNDDVLLLPKERARISVEFAAVAPALHFPELCDALAVADKAANLAKRRLRTLGLSSIGLVTASLLIASAAPMYHNDRKLSLLLVSISAISGIVGGMVGAGLTSKRWRTAWLENRLISESFRQLHFRLLLVLAREITCAATSNDWSKFRQKRVAALDTIKTNIEQRKSSLLYAIAQDYEVRPNNIELDLPEIEIFSTVHGQAILRAYRELRIVRQHQFADYKLLDHGGLFSQFPRAQSSTLGGLALACIMALFALHLSSAALLTWSSNQMPGPLLELGAVWTAIIALALRAAEQGLKPELEIERYRHYQALTARLLEQFDASQIAGKLEAAKIMEREALEEMCLFLRSYYKTQFAI